MRQNPHVRICGGPGSATTLVYPTGGRRHVQAGRGVTTLDDGSTKRLGFVFEEVGARERERVGGDA